MRKKYRVWLFWEVELLKTIENDICPLCEPLSHTHTSSVIRMSSLCRSRDSVIKSCQRFNIWSSALLIGSVMPEICLVWARDHLEMFKYGRILFWYGWTLYVNIHKNNVTKIRIFTDSLDFALFSDNTERTHKLFGKRNAKCICKMCMATADSCILYHENTFIWKILSCTWHRII